MAQRANNSEPFCQFCGFQTPEPLIIACGCKGFAKYHFSCLRTQIIHTLDSKCRGCGQKFRETRIKRIPKRRDRPFIKSLASRLIYVPFVCLFWLFVRGIIPWVWKSGGGVFLWPWVHKKLETKSFQRLLPLSLRQSSRHMS